MLQITPTTISLHTFQKRYNVKLINSGEQAVIFKILSNSQGSFELDRNAGCLRPHTRLQLMITVLKREPFKAKLQILHGKLTNANLPYNEAWKKLKSSSVNIFSTTISISLRNEQDEQPDQLDDSSFVRPKSLDSKASKSQVSRDERANRQNKHLPAIKQDVELEYLLAKGGIKKNQQTMKTVMNHIETERKKHIDAEEREELLYTLEQMDRKHKDELNRSERLAQQLEIAQKKIQNHSDQMFKFQVGRSLGVHCEEYHTSFTGLVLLTLACFLFGYAFASF